MLSKFEVTYDALSLHNKLFKSEMLNFAISELKYATRAKGTTSKFGARLLRYICKLVMLSDVRLQSRRQRNHHFPLRLGNTRKGKADGAGKIEVRGCIESL